MPEVALDVNARTITIDGASLTVPDSVDLSAYLTEQDADAKYANKSEIKDVSIDVANRTIKIGNDTLTVPENVDLSQYAKTGDVPKIALNTFTRTLTVNGQSVSIPANVDLSGYATKSDLSAYITVTDADAKYAKKSDVENASKSNSSNVHVYKTDVDVPNTMRNQSGIGFDKLQCVFTGYTVNDAKVGDVVINTTGSVYKVNKLYYQEVAVEKTPILKGNSLTKLSDFDKTQTQQMSIIAKEKVKSFLQMNDTDAYTLNVDECTLTNETTKTTTKLVPAIYPLRDLNISNLSIKSKTNFGLKDAVRSNPVQLTITPYAVVANVVTSDYSAGGTGTTEQMFWHPVWLYDLSEWYGITAAWHKLP